MSGGQSVRFFDKQVKDEGQSKQAGYPITKTRIYIEFVTPGILDHTFARPVLPHDADMYPQEWARYQNSVKAEESAVGWRVENWNALDRIQMEHLKSLQFHTVEQIAEASDSQLMRIMGGMQWRTRAQAALASRNDSVAAEKMAAQNQALMDRLAEMESKMAAMQAEKRGPGRPRKDEAAA